MTMHTTEWWIDEEKAQFGDRRRSRGASPQNQYYGYMDEHKKSMIQQWVECQAAQAQQQARGGRMIPVKAPAAISSSSDDAEVKSEVAPEPFAWLREKGEINSSEDCRVLTHFRTLDSSGSSEEGFVGKKSGSQTFTTEVDVHGNDDKVSNGDPVASVPPSPAVSSVTPEEEEKVKNSQILSSKEGQNGDEDGEASDSVSFPSPPPPIANDFEEEDRTRPFSEEAGRNFAEKGKDLLFYCICPSLSPRCSLVSLFDQQKAQLPLWPKKVDLGFFGGKKRETDAKIVTFFPSPPHKRFVWCKHIAPRRKNT